jgi:hypothetical protein
MIRSPRDVSSAFDEGRVHRQRFLKNAGSAGDNHWQDWSYASGQPAYDARIGDALTLTPIVAAANDAIFFPPVAAPQTRHLCGLSVYVTAGGTGQLAVEFEMYDLLAVYPLIDGDNTDPQAMDNALPLPRYADGMGVRAVLVNHIAPALAAGSPIVIDYTDAVGTARSLTVYSAVFGAGKASFSMQTTGASTGALYLPTDGPGVRSIETITFTTAPGGLWAVYMVKPMARVNWRGGLAGVTQTVFSERDLCAVDSFNLPRVLDGAHLGFFYMPNGSARTVAMFGQATFIWG